MVSPLYYIILNLFTSREGRHSSSGPFTDPCGSDFDGHGVKSIAELAVAVYRGIFQGGFESHPGVFEIFSAPRCASPIGASYTEYDFLDLPSDQFHGSI